MDDGYQLGLLLGEEGILNIEKTQDFLKLGAEFEFNKLDRDRFFKHSQKQTYKPKEKYPFFVCYKNKRSLWHLEQDTGLELVLHPISSMADFQQFKESVNLFLTVEEHLKEEDYIFKIIDNQIDWQDVQTLRNEINKYKDAISAQYTFSFDILYFSKFMRKILVDMGDFVHPVVQENTGLRKVDFSKELSRENSFSDLIFLTLNSISIGASSDKRLLKIDGANNNPNLAKPGKELLRYQQVIDVQYMNTYIPFFSRRSFSDLYSELFNKPSEFLSALYQKAQLDFKNADFDTMIYGGRFPNNKQMFETKMKNIRENKKQEDVCIRVEEKLKNKNIDLVLKRFFQLDAESNEQTNKLLDADEEDWDYGEGMAAQPTGWLYACVMDHKEYLDYLREKGFLEKFFLSISSPKQAKYYFFNEDKKCIDSTDRDHDLCHPFDCDAHGIEHLSVNQNKKDLFYNERIMPYTAIIECRTLDPKWRSLSSIEALFNNLKELFGIFNKAFQEVKSN